MELQPLFAALAVMDLALAGLSGFIWRQERQQPRHQQRFRAAPFLPPTLAVIFLINAVLCAALATKG
jgi:hypothetical protein